MVSSWPHNFRSRRLRHSSSKWVFSSSQLATRGTGTRKFRRAYPTSPSTFPLSFPFPGRPNLTANRQCDCNSLKTCVGFRSPSPKISFTAIFVLSYRMVRGTPPKYAKAWLWPSRNDSVFSAGNALTKQSSDCGKSMHRKCAFCSSPPTATSASPKSTCASTEAVLCLQPIPDPLRRVSLFLWLRLVILQNLVNDPQPRAQLRSLHRLL